jgi:hypothetical protein
MIVSCEWFKDGLELVAPTLGLTEKSKLSLSDFKISDKGRIKYSANI